MGADGISPQAGIPPVGNALTFQECTQNASAQSRTQIAAQTLAEGAAHRAAYGFAQFPANGTGYGVAYALDAVLNSLFPLLPLFFCGFGLFFRLLCRLL